MIGGRAATDAVIPGRYIVSVGNPNKQLPPGWAWARLSELAELGTGHTPSRKHPEYWNGDIPWIGVRDAGRHHGGIIMDTAQHVTELGVANSAARLLPENTVCLSRTASVGYVVIMGRPMATSQDFVTWSCGNLLDPQYLMHALLAEGEEIRRFGEGSTHTTIYFPEVKAFHIGLPPRREQHQIVAKIKSLSGKSKRVRDHLDHIPRLVEKYKQAILAAAFRGDLGRKARSTKSGGEDHPIVELQETCTSISDGDHQAPPQAKTGIPFITIASMNDGIIDLNKATRFVPQSYADALKSTRRPAVGDILYSVTGSICIPAVVNFDDPFVFQRHIAILKPEPQKIDSIFLYRLLSAPQVVDQALAVATGTAQLTVPLSGLRELKIPLPSLDEQRLIAQRIETAFSWIKRLASEATSARKLIDHLDQAVLAKAFRGELVPQDPNDEPASVLLERIRGEGAATPAKVKMRGPKQVARQRRPTRSAKSIPS